ncbi:FHA domain-containing protein [Chloroflexota bacterium]
MKERWLLVTLLLAIFLGSALPATAQGVVNVSVDELVFDQYPQSKALVTVRNENGVPILGLGPEAFEIVEDGRSSFPPSETAVHTNPDAVVSVVMAIDVSGSMKGKPIKEAIRAANALLDQLSLEDRTALIAFADRMNLDIEQLEEGREVGFTTDKNALRNVVNFLDTKIGWDTPLYDAIFKAVRLVSAEPAGKRAVVVMTDGRDERDNAQGKAVVDAGSLSTPDDPINEANRHNIPVFTIGLEGLGGKIDQKYLRRLAERTGGAYQKAPEPEELTPLFENVVDQLKQQYILTYNTGLPDDDSLHSVMVRVQLPQGQAFDEIKLQVRPSDPEPAPPPTVAAGEPTTVAAVGSGLGSAVVEVAVPEPAPAEPDGIIDTLKTTFEENPILVVVIGAGILLLVVLIVVLVAVLLGSRRGSDEDFYSEEFEPTHAPAPDWAPGPTDPSAPAMPPPVAGRTEMGPSDWPGAAPAATEIDQQPQGGAPPEAAIPAAGGTRVIERAPKHLAMLVDKTRPERKYDLKGTMNIGRGSENQIVLEDATVSRQHAWIKSEGEAFLVFDVGSGNGTFVNEEQVQEPRHLENGDVIRFGDAQFVFTKVF